tara:strand:+ start:590 stop:808 length:219 start_codon:yes stop_codon:yes gene_type:complete
LLIQVDFYFIAEKNNFEFKWKHYITKRPFYRNFFDHKGYYFYAKEREKDELKFLKKSILRDSCVLEVGRHIG